jgi:oligopeptide transport system substrate-binding protein
MTRRFLFLALATALLVGGCKPRDTATPAAGSRVLHLGNGTEPQDLDPQIVTGVPENKIVNAIFEGLVAYGPNGQGTIPAAAASWSISEDGLIYTFNLQPNGRWSNGDPVTAADFVGSYRRILNPKLASEYANKLYPVVGAREFHEGKPQDFSKTGFKALDARTLQITLKRPTSFLIESLKHYAWFPVHLPTVEKFGGLERKGSAWTKPGNLVGNGPYLLTEWAMQQRVIVDQSPTYWDRAALRTDRIVFYPTENIETEERMFRTGQLHKTYELPLDKTDVYRREQPESLRIDPLLGIYFFRINLTRPPLNDKRIRRALALAINREVIVEKVTRQNQKPAYNACPPMESFTSPVRLTGDLAEARRLLAEAGYPEGKGLRPIELLYNTSQNHKKIAEALQQMWRQNLGVDISLVNQEWKVYLDSQDTLSYDLSRAGWIADYVDPNTFFDLWRTGDGNNDTGFANAEYDRLLEEALGTSDQAARRAIYARMDAILMDELPIIPLYFYTRTYAANPRLQAPPNLVETPNYKFIYLRD